MDALSARGMAALVLISTLSTGVLGGVILERFYLSAPSAARMTDERDAPRERSRPEGARRDRLRVRSPADMKRLSDELARRLELTAGQRVRVDSIMARAVPRVNALEDETRVRMNSVLDELRAELSGVLTPEQRTRLDDALRPRRRGRQPRPD